MDCGLILRKIKASTKLSITEGWGGWVLFRWTPRVFLKNDLADLGRPIPGRSVGRGYSWRGHPPRPGNWPRIIRRDFANPGLVDCRFISRKVKGFHETFYGRGMETASFISMNSTSFSENDRRMPDLAVHPTDRMAESTPWRGHLPRSKNWPRIVRRD